MNEELEDLYENFVRNKKIFKVAGKPVRFARYGGLSPVPQKGFKRWKNVDEPDDIPIGISFDDEEGKKLPPTFHTPPARKGIYAFLWPYVELFLLGGTTKWEYKKDHKGNKIYDPDDVEKKWPEKQIPKMRVFDYYGDIWHHLKETTPRNKILIERGDWIKTSFETYIEALKKEVHNALSSDIFSSWGNTKNAKYDPNWKRTGQPFSNITKDHLEVFIEDLH